jgi:hypothetical protein
MSARVGLALVLGASVTGAACGGLRHVTRDPAHAARLSTLSATLRGNPMELHLAVPPTPLAADVLVLYASGDGGWFGAAVDMFHAIGDAGFYAVGVSSRGLLHREISGHRAPGVGDLAADYQSLLDQATAALHLPADRRVVLTGWSRGASLAVLLGSPRHAPRGLAGVVAIGLSEEDNLDLRYDSDDDPPAETAVSQNVLRAPGAVDLYGLIEALAPHRCAVIQATGDKYLSAARARALFGADTDLRRFFEVTAPNHRFSGAGPVFGDRLAEALRWIVADSQQRSAE